MNFFLVDMDDGSKRSVQVYNTRDSSGDLYLKEIYSQDLLTAVKDAKKINFFPSFVMANTDNFSAIILPLVEENDSILFMEVPQYSSLNVVTDGRRKLCRLFGSRFPLVFSHLTELEYTFL